MFNGRKAQITIFIIIGIVLLFSSALIIYIKNKTAGITNFNTPSENTPEELTGMKKYIEDCIFITGKNAVDLIGKHGGYIYPQKVFPGRKPIIPDSNNPTEASGVETIPGDGGIIPYWDYLSTSNTCKGNCKFSSEMPPLIGDDPRSIESQISDYVNTNFRTCLNNFEPYINLGYDIKQGTPKTKTTVTQTDVVVDVTWPIEAGRTNSKLNKMERFVIRLPVNLRGAYDFAKLITEKQREKHYIEDHTLNLITYYSSKDENKIPPKADFTMESSASNVWMFDDVKQKLSNLILPNYNYWLRIKNSDNEQRLFYSQRMTQTILDKSIIDLNDSNIYHPYEVSFDYINWPIYFDITPRNGQVIQPKNVLGGAQIATQIAGLDPKQYEFQYDLSFPVIVSIYDKKAFNNELIYNDNEGFTFRFALEGNIRNNNAINSSFDPLTLQSFERTFVCDNQQRTSGNITVSTYDSLTLKPLDDVAVKFSFGGETCDIGFSKMNNLTNESSLVAKYPSPAVGSLIFFKEGYIKKSIPIFGTKNDVEKYIGDIYLDPIVEKNISVKTYHIDKKLVIVNDSGVITTYCDTWKFNSTKQQLRPNESVSIYLNKVPTDESPDNKPFFSIIYNGSTPNANRNSTISIGPGKYELRVSSVLYEKVTIPAITRTYGSGRNTFRQSFAAVDAPSEEGTINFNNETIYFEVTQDLYKNSSIEFHALVYDFKSVNKTCLIQPEDLLISSGINTIMDEYKRILLPSIIPS